MKHILLSLTCISHCTESAMHLAHIKSLDYPKRQKIVKNTILAAYITAFSLSLISSFFITRYNYNNNQAKTTNQLLFTTCAFIALSSGLALQHYTNYKLIGKFFELSSYGLIIGILFYTSIYKITVRSDTDNVTLSPTASNDPATTPRGRIAQSEVKSRDKK